jgi:O-glycosyl hydrolase
MKLRFLQATAGFVVVISACSGEQSSSNPSPRASGGSATGGAATGGRVATGGLSSAGGIAAIGGVSVAGGAGLSGASSGGAAGGASTTGGARATGGVATTSSGGASTAGTGGSSGPRPTVTAVSGTTLVKVDTGKRYQTFEGWGTSLCWWANHVGGWSATARSAVVDAVVNPATGLGYNVFRYNIGGGENPDHEHMGEHREMPGFAPAAGQWDWEADANQRAVLEEIAETGSEVILEAFSNSPPYWMTKSGCASGSSDGSNNLKDDSYEAFADYLTEVVKHFKETWGITFRTLEPLNEPNSNWWKSNGGQEGCHFSPSNQETLIRAVAAKLKDKGLTETAVSASDENSMDETYNNLRSFTPATMDATVQVNTHSYAGSRRTEVRTLTTIAGKRLWQSESGPLGQDLSGDLEAAMFMAGRIITDLKDLKPEAWVDWQIGDPGRNWASLWLDDAKQSFTPLKRFYMHAGFSRYIRPGAVFVDVSNRDMVAAVSGDQRMLTVVVRNPDAAATKGFTFDLTTLPAVGSMVEVHRTSQDEDLEAVAPIAIDGFSFVAMLRPNSVTTFVVPMQ